MKSAIVFLFQLPIRFYCLVISPLMGPRCRFHPTCSAYTLDALKRHGVLKGLFLGAVRIIKCNPWCKTHWHDPVPKRFEWNVRERICGALRKGENSAINAEHKSHQ